jgi:hypothetical protein
MSQQGFSLSSFKRSTCLYCQTLRIYVFLIEYGILILIIVAFVFGINLILEHVNMLYEWTTGTWRLINNIDVGYKKGPVHFIEMQGFVKPRVNAWCYICMISEHAIIMTYKIILSFLINTLGNILIDIFM